jgi:predicted NBD/HSP70 family sugar kinase
VHDLLPLRSHVRPRLHTSSGPVVTIDLGGTKALAGVVEADGSVRSRVWLPSRELNGRPAELMDCLSEAACSAASEARLPFAAIQSAGVRVPGPLSSSRSPVTKAMVARDAVGRFVAFEGSSDRNV